MPERKQNEYADALRLQCKFGFGIQCSTHSCSPFHRQGHLLCYRAKDRGQVCSQTLTILYSPVRNREVLIKTRFESEDEVCVAAARV